MSVSSISSSSSTSFNQQSNDDDEENVNHTTTAHDGSKNEPKSSTTRTSTTSNESLGDATSGNTTTNTVKTTPPVVVVVGSPPANFQQSASIPIVNSVRATPPLPPPPPAGHNVAKLSPLQRRAVSIMDENRKSTNPFDVSNASKYADLWDSRSSTPPTDSLEIVEFMRSHSTSNMSHMPRTFHFDQQQHDEQKSLPPFVRMSSSSSLTNAPSPALVSFATPLTGAAPPSTTGEPNSKSEISAPAQVPDEDVNCLHVPTTFAEQFRKRSVSNANDVIVASSTAATAAMAKPRTATVAEEPAIGVVVVPESYANPISSEAPADLAAHEQIPPALSGKTADEEDLKDPWCDPEKPRKITFADVAAAAVRIRAIPVTSCQRSHFIADVTGIDVYLKKEIENYTGSFKERGVRNALLNLSEAQRRKGVVAASAGNHALGLCHHGKLLGVPVTVVMPTVAPLMKVSNCQALGGNITIIGSDVVEAKKHAMRLGRDRGLMYLNGYDHPDVLAGQGSIGIELLAQVPDCDAVIVPVGGGGLICGIATAVKALKPDIKVIGVQSHRACAFTFSMREGYAVSCPVKATLADGLAVSKPGVNSVYSSLGLIDKMILVSEDYIALAILRLLEWEKLVAEGAGAIGLAAVFSGQLDEFKGKKVAIIISGGNIDTTILGRCIERGLAVDGRLCRFAVTVTDRPGSIRELTRCIAAEGVSIKDIVHERAWLKSDIFSVQVTCIVETRNAAHAQQLESVLRDKYDRVVFPKTWIDIDDTSFGLQLNDAGTTSGSGAKALEA